MVVCRVRATSSHIVTGQAPARAGADRRGVSATGHGCGQANSFGPTNILPSKIDTYCIDLKRLRTLIREKNRQGGSETAAGAGGAPPLGAGAPEAPLRRALFKGPGFALDRHPVRRRGRHAENNGWLIFDGSETNMVLGNATPLEVENIILGDSQDDSADNEEDSDVCSDEVDSSDDSESSLESDYE
ncbi:hypothetical protein EVAR_76124_1 [Eumeta japonica]|uniref:Uncharacterized protein n=1 Tax=Eumeta variegata TaxID=151549 RepID=A0A4C1UVR3_EUMVA|nr:hypothetical protein EVAR_76124_1 [Eumeta japonica]